MPNDIRTCPWATRPDSKRSFDALLRCRDPDVLLEYGMAVQAAFELMAHAECDNVMKSVYLEMAGFYRWANKDVERRLRDISG